MSQSMRNDQTRRTAKAVAVARVQTVTTALTTLILGVILVLLCGAVWTQLT